MGACGNKHAEQPAAVQGTAPVKQGVAPTLLGGARSGDDAAGVKPQLVADPTLVATSSPVQTPKAAESTRAVASPEASVDANMSMQVEVEVSLKAEASPQNASPQANTSPVASASATPKADVFPQVDAVPQAEETPRVDIVLETLEIGSPEAIGSPTSGEGKSPQAQRRGEGCQSPGSQPGAAMGSPESPAGGAASTVPASPAAPPSPPPAEAEVFVAFAMEDEQMALDVVPDSAAEMVVAKAEVPVKRSKEGGCC